MKCWATSSLAALILAVPSPRPLKAAAQAQQAVSADRPSMRRGRVAWCDRQGDIPGADRRTHGSHE